MIVDTRILGVPLGIGTARPTPIAVGCLPEVIDDYTVVRAIGHGGMGSVFEVCHKTLGRRFALKVLSESLCDNQEAVERFRSETLALGKLEHPNIVFAIDAGLWEGLPFLVTELLKGNDLEYMVVEHGVLDVETVISVASQLANALDYAHERGFFHRDIKPSNVFYQPDGKAILLDFGLVRSQSSHSLTQAGCFMGTVDFVAPEQARNAALANAASDIYSLGCTLIFMLSGDVPFPDSRFPSVTAKLHAHLQDTPEWLNQTTNEIPGWLLSLIRSMVAKRPGDRPASCAAIHDSLQNRNFAVSQQSTEKSCRRFNGQISSRNIALGAGIAIVVSAGCWTLFVGKEIDVQKSTTNATLDSTLPVTQSNKAVRFNEKTLPTNKVQNARGFIVPAKSPAKKSAPPTFIHTRETK